MRKRRIAFPLLVLSLTGSASATGLVLGTSAAAALAAGLPAGALVDRWNRKKVMLGCEAAKVIAATTLVVALVVGVASVAHIVIVAAVMGVCSALFEPAENACLPSLMSTEQVPRAVAMNAARGHLGQLSGTAAGGFPVCCRKIRAIRGGHADPCRVLLLAHVHPPAGAPGTTRAGRSTRPRDCGRLSLGVAAPPGSSHRLVRRGAQPVLRSLLHRHHRGGTSTRRIVWRDRHYGGDVRCRWDPWRPGRPLPAAEGHSLCLDRRGVLGSDGCHSAGSLRQQCLSAGIAIRWYGISRPDCGHHDRYLPTSAHTRRNARQDDREQLSGVGYPPSLVRGGCADTAARPGQIASANL